MGKNRKNPTEPPNLPRAVSRLLGAWLGSFALAVTYVTAVLSSVGAPTALMRACIAWALFFTLGRVIGWIAGRLFESSLREDAPSGADVEVAA